MKKSIVPSAILATVLTAAVSLIAGTAGADTKNVAFPSGYDTDYVLYYDVDKPNKKRGPTYRKFYVNKSALAAVKAGKPLPSGTVLIREDWFVKQDGDKNAIKGTNGRYVPTDKKAVFVMEKRDGWGADYPAGKRNGNWEYAAFKKDGARNEKMKIGNCFGCHLKVKNTDYVFSLKDLKATAKK